MTWHKDGARPTPQGSGIDYHKVLVVVAVAFLVRLIPVLNGANWTDLYGAQAVPILKLQNIYSAAPGVFPYTPVSMFIPALCGLISIKLQIPFHIVMKLPSIAADIAIAALVFTALSGLGNKKAFLWGILYALNPVSILISAFHGNLIVASTLFSFLAYTVLLRGVQANYRLSALLLGLAIGLRSYPVLLLPLFLLKLGLSVRQRVEFALYATLPSALSCIPFFLLDRQAFMREIFSYSGFTDYGLAAILRAFHSLQEGSLLFVLPGGLHTVLASASKFAFLAVYPLIIVALVSRRISLVRSIIVVFLAFYFIVSGVSSQYFIWILPFAFLVRGRWLGWYEGIVTWALISFYWLYHTQILFGKLPAPSVSLVGMLWSELASLSILWAFCLTWAVFMLGQKDSAAERGLI